LYGPVTLLRSGAIANAEALHDLQPSHPERTVNVIKHLLLKTLGGSALLAAMVAGSAGFASTASASVLSDSGGGNSYPSVTSNAPTAGPCVDVVANPSDPEHWPCAIQGRPSKLDDGSTRGWYFWHDANGLHLDTTTPLDRDHYFTAVLTTRGTFRDMDKVHHESVDDVKLTDGGHKLVVRFHTHDGIDGVNFHVDGGDSLTLRLDQGGHLIDRANIFMGHNNVHPASNPFTIHR
jgi:hypothetical protein